MKNNTLRTVISVICAVLLVIAAFFAGFFTRSCTRYGSVSSYEWALETINKNYYFGGVDAGYSDTSISAIAEKYLDRYSEYYTAEEYKAALKSNSGSKSGIGISYSFVENRGVYISSVVGNSPAYMCGLRAGEWLVSGGKGGANSAFGSVNDFAKLVTSASDGEDMTLVSAGGESYTVAKAEYTASYCSMSTKTTAWVFGDAEAGGLALYERPEEKIPSLPDGAAYFRLSQFYGTAAAEFYRLVEKFNSLNCTTMLIDLRSNGGGYVSVMQDIAGCFSDGGKKLAMLSRDKNGGTEKFRCAEVEQKYQVSKDVKVYVAANSGTASASEALIGAMIVYGATDYGNVYLSQYSQSYLDWLKESGQELKTGRTYGKGIMQSTFVNPKTGEALKLTTAQIYWPDSKTCIHDRGILASDGCVLAPAEWQHTLPDEELEWIIGDIKSKA